MKKQLKQLKRLALFFFVILLNYGSLNAQIFPHEYIIKNGSPSSKVNLVFVGDGYRSDQMNKYIADVKRTVNGMFAQEPFRSLKSKFNVIAIKVPSNVSGAASSPDALIDNYFGSTYNYNGIQRLLVPYRSDRVASVINDNFPDQDQGVVIVNDSRYGGSGGRYATFSTSSSAVELLIHELGHSYSDLADEYWFRAQEKANQTANGNSSTIKWKNFIGQEGVGIYRYESPGSNYFRPHQNCKMRYLGSSFCLVCQNQITKVTNGLVGGGGDLGVPQNLRTVNVGSTSFTITWSGVSGATSYDIQTWDGSVWVDHGSTSNKPYKLKGYSEGNTEYVRVRASNSESTSSWTKHIIVNLGSTNGTLPATPSELKAKNVKASSFDFVWDEVSGATSYDIQSWDGESWIDKGSKTSNLFSFTGLSTGSTYYVRLRATNASGSSSWTDHITVKLNSSNSTPDIPKGLKSYKVGSFSFGVTWSLVDGATEYEVQDWNGSKWISVGSTSKHYYWFSNLSSGTKYYVRVRSKNDSGESSYTEHITVSLPSSIAAPPVGNINIMLYPNPVDKKLFIRGLDKDVKRISVTDINGALMMDLLYSEQEIDLSALGSGLYFLKISFNDGSSINRKIIKE